MSNGFVVLLEHQEDRGVNAVINSLKEMGVMTWSHERLCFQFKEITVTQESLNHYINKNLGK